jgi:pyruvate kinase
MLAKIAAAVEPHRPASAMHAALEDASRDCAIALPDLIARSVGTVLDCTSAAAVFVPTHSGYTARRIARFRLPVWIVAVSSQEQTCQKLQFSYGVLAVHEPEHPETWKRYTRQWLRDNGVDGELVILTEGPSSKHPETNNRMEIISFGK